MLFWQISSHAVLSGGMQALSGAAINANSKIGEGAVIYLGANVEYNCHIGRYNCAAPRAVFSCNIKIGSYYYIGPCAIVIQGI